MTAPIDTRAPARAVLAGRVIGGAVALFLAADAAGKLFAPAAMIANSPPLGLAPDPGLYRTLGALLTACTALYVWPRTRVPGAVLLTGYLGGAVALHLRVGSPPATHTLFPVYLGIALWTALWLRDPRVRALVA